LRAQGSALRGDFPAAGAFALDFFDMRVLEDGRSGAFRGARQSGDQAGGVYSGAGFID
jgi:hypothetical protein